MAATRGRQSPPVEDQLFGEPGRFGFFQAVRLLERMWEDRGAADVRDTRTAVGRDEFPQREIVRLRAAPTLGFPSRDVLALERAAPQDKDDPRAPPEMPPTMTVSFMGLVGPAGVLPDHYTELVIRRLRLKDRALRDLLDMFDHRAISLFQRAWEKYRYPILYERAAGKAAKEDLFTWCLSAIAGMGTESQRGRVEVDDEAFVHFGGSFGREVRTADSLEDALNEYFELPIKVEQFHGDWIRLDIADRSLIGSAANRQGSYARLGVDLIVGSRVFDVSSRFRVRVGPLTYAQFKEFMPTGSLLRPVSHFVRTYVGVEFDFDVQPVLKPNEAPHLLLGNDGADPPRLGWNTWLRANPVPWQFEGVSFSLVGARSWVVETSTKSRR